jgi:hypothetical protein
MKSIPLRKTALFNQKSYFTEKKYNSIPLTSSRHFYKITQ